MFLSLGGNKQTALTHAPAATLDSNDDGTYSLVKSLSSYIELRGMNGSFDYLYLDVNCRDVNGNVVPVDIKLSIADEGNSSYYDLPTTSIYPSIEKTKYIKAYSYGNVRNMRVYFTCDYDATLTVNNIIYNANPPLFFSFVRFLLIYLILLILWCIRPKSSLYQKNFSVNSKLIIIYVAFIINAGICSLLCKNQIPYSSLYFLLRYSV